MSVEPARRRGIVPNGEMLSQLMAERNLQADQLAAMARVSEDTVSRARAGGRIEHTTLRKIADALLRAPATNPLVAQLVTKKTAEAGSSSAVKGEADGTGIRPHR